MNSRALIRTMILVAVEQSVISERLRSVKCRSSMRTPLPVWRLPKRASRVGAEVLKRLFGTDQVNFKDCGATLPAGSTCYDAKPVLRSYTSFSRERRQSVSRIFVGFHFRNATVEGTAYGRKIGGARLAQLLQPVK